MGTVSELQVGDGARVRVGFELNVSHQDFWLKETFTLNNLCGSERTIFGLSLYHTIYVKFR